MGAIIGAAVIGAGATVGSAAIAANAGKKWAYPGSTNVYNPSMTQPYAGANALLAASLGLPPSGDMQTAGPFQSALNEYYARGYGGSKGARRINQFSADLMNFMGQYLDARENGVRHWYYPSQAGLSGEEVRSMDPEDVFKYLKPFKHWEDQMNKLLAASGWTSVNDLFNAQVSYNQEIESVLADHGVIREHARNLIRDSWQKRTEAMASLPGGTAEDIEEYRLAEEERMEADFERYDRDALRKAQFGGFNPSAALEESARLRETGNNEALARALTLIEGEQLAAARNIGNINALDPTTGFLPLVPGMVAAGTPRQISPTSGISGGAQQPSPWAGAVSEVGNLAGEAILTYASQPGRDAVRQNTIDAIRASSPAYEGASPLYTPVG